MKFLLPVFVIFILFSCGNTKPLIDVEDDANDEIENAVFTSGVESIPLYSRDKMDTVTSSISYQFYTHPSKAYQDSINVMINIYLRGNTDAEGEPIIPTSSVSQQTMKDALNYFSELYNSEIEMYEEDEEYFGAIWSMEKSVSISDARFEYAQLSLSGWEYSGGAHGNAWSQDILVDLKTGNTLYLEDFFTDVSALTAIAGVIFRADQELGADDDLGDAGFWFEDGEFRLNENFMFGNETIEFLYNQYEIAPYAAGIIELSIPLTKVKHLLKRKID